MVRLKQATHSKTKRPVTQPGRHVESYLYGLSYPASKQEVLNYVQNHNAPLEVMRVIDKLADLQYHDLLDVLKEVEKLQSHILVKA
jgi:hypothetical protein